MKTLLKSLKITLAFCVFFSVFYILILWIFAQVAGPNKGNAEVATLDGKVVGAANVGQMFTKDIYFWGRPSHPGDGYDAASSSGSNKGPTNEEYLSEVEARIDTFLVLFIWSFVFLFPRSQTYCCARLSTTPVCASARFTAADGSV